MSGILEDLQEQEQVKDLADDIRGLITQSELNQSHQEIEVKHTIGRMIVEHQAYKKGAHGTGRLIKELSILIEKSTQDLHYCIQFYEKYPELSNALESLAPDQVKLSWRDVIHDLADKEDPADCVHPDTYIIKFKVCRDCGKREKL